MISGQSIIKNVEKALGFRHNYCVYLEELRKLQNYQDGINVDHAEI
jgi:hypothetical protein